jgi:hypothetical protein
MPQRDTAGVAAERVNIQQAKSSLEHRECSGRVSGKRNCAVNTADGIAVDRVIFTADFGVNGGPTAIAAAANSSNTTLVIKTLSRLRMGGTI